MEQPQQDRQSAPAPGDSFALGAEWITGLAGARGTGVGRCRSISTWCFQVVLRAALSKYLSTFSYPLSLKQR